MENIIACNLGSYRQFRSNAYAHLAEIGLTNVEIGVPAAESVDAVISELDSHGLTATSLLGSCNVQSDTVVTDFQPTLEIANQMDVKIIFVSVHAGDTDRKVVYDRLRAIGEKRRHPSILKCVWRLTLISYTMVTSLLRR